MLRFPEAGTLGITSPRLGEEAFCGGGMQLLSEICDQRRGSTRKTPNSLFCSLVSAGTFHWATQPDTNWQESGRCSPLQSAPGGMELGREVESRSLGTHREQAAQKLYKCLISRLILVLSVYPSGLRCHVSTQGTWTSMWYGGQWYCQSVICFWCTVAYC